MSYDLTIDERLAHEAAARREAATAGALGTPLTYVVRETGRAELRYRGEKFSDAVFWTETLRERGSLDCCEVDGMRLRPDALLALERLTEVARPFAGWAEGCSTLPPLRGNREPTWAEVLAAQSAAPA